MLSIEDEERFSRFTKTHRPLPLNNGYTYLVYIDANHIELQKKSDRVHTSISF